MELWQLNLMFGSLVAMGASVVAIVLEGLTFEDPDGYHVVLQHSAWDL
jgi:hypothetical protein